MKKQKILGLKHTNDSYWFKFSGNNQSLGCLEDLFGITESDWYEYNELEDYSLSFYESLIKDGDNSYLIDEEDCLAYIILTKKRIHFILRKVRKYEKVKKDIMKKFEFKVDNN